jgi:glucan biosynthesis protein C
MASAPSVASRSRQVVWSSFRRRDTANATHPHSRPATDRLAYVDAIRLAALALVFLGHVSEIFNPWDEWHITNGQRSRLAGEVAVFVAPWVMPMIMLLAGVSAWYSLRGRGAAAYVSERIVRLLVPLALGTLILVPPQVYLERRLRGQFTGSFLAFYPHFFDGLYPDGNLSWHHLWFLAHLFLYSLIALPLFLFWKRSGRRQTMHWVARVCATPGGILWLAVPLILERNVLWGLFPERHMLTSDWSNHALLFVAYVYGFIMAGSPWLGRAIDAQWPKTLGVGVLGTSVLAVGTWQGVLPAQLPPPYSLRYLAFWTLYGVCAWAWMAAVLGMARRWLSAERPILRYGRRVGLEVYILHQPIIVAVAFIVVQQRMPIAAKFAIILVVSSLLTLFGAEILRRLYGALRAVGRPRLAETIPERAR